MLEFVLQKAEGLPPLGFGLVEPTEPEFCPKCGALLELRVSRGAGVTRYKQFCTGDPPYRL